MRVVEPKELDKRRRQRAKKQKRLKLISIVIGFACIIAAFIFWKVVSRLDLNVLPNLTSKNQDQQTQLLPEPSPPKTKLKNFSGNEFRDLYRSINYPNTQAITEPPEITGNNDADKRIRELAEKRGFALTSIPIAPISKTEEPLLSNSEDDLLQPLALKSWVELKEAARKDGVEINLLSGYRSLKWQRELFLERLMAQGASISQIAAGQADNAIETTLHLTAVPGYSRHHTGYTIDLNCEGYDGSFINSKCYQWLNASNYEKCKKYGWIPSYPEDAEEQGPEPEAWEYVWVGTDVLYE